MKFKYSAAFLAVHILGLICILLKIIDNVFRRGQLRRKDDTWLPFRYDFRIDWFQTPNSIDSFQSPPKNHRPLSDGAPPLSREGERV